MSLAFALVHIISLTQHQKGRMYFERCSWIRILRHPIIRTAGAASFNVETPIVVTSHNLTMNNQGWLHWFAAEYVGDDRRGGT